jgi:hypothetical protein
MSLSVPALKEKWSTTREPAASRRTPQLSTKARVESEARSSVATSMLPPSSTNASRSLEEGKKGVKVEAGEGEKWCRRQSC